MHQENHSGHVPQQPGASHSSTKTLLDRGRVGDRSALDRVFSRLVTHLRRWAHGRLSRGAHGVTDTADVVQDAALGVWKKLDSIDIQRPGDLEAYVRKSVQNRIRDEARRVGRTPERVELQSNVEDPAASPLEEAASRQFFERYAAVLGTLDPSEREIIVARFEMGYTYEQIAEMFGKPSPAAARMNVNRIIARMQTRLKVDGNE